MNTKLKTFLIIGIILNVIALLALGFQTFVVTMSIINPLIGFLLGYPFAILLGFGVLIIAFIALPLNYSLFKSEYKTVGTIVFTINVAIIVLTVVIALGGPMYIMLSDRLNALQQINKNSSSSIQ